MSLEDLLKGSYRKLLLISTSIILVIFIVFLTNLLSTDYSKIYWMALITSIFFVSFTVTLTFKRSISFSLFSSTVVTGLVLIFFAFLTGYVSIESLSGERAQQTQVIYLGGLNIPIYVPILAYLGAIAYVSLSAYKTYRMRMEKEREEMYQKWTSRVIAAPLFAIAFYSILITGFGQIQAQPSASLIYVMAAISFFTGFYIKTAIALFKKAIMNVLIPEEVRKDEIREIEEEVGPLKYLFDARVIRELVVSYGVRTLYHFTLLEDSVLKEISQRTGTSFNKLIEVRDSYRTVFEAGIPEQAITDLIREGYVTVESFSLIKDELIEKIAEKLKIEREGLKSRFNRLRGKVD